MSSFFEKIAAAVGGFHLVFDGVGEGHFDDVRGVMGGFTSPVPEAGAKTVGHIVALFALGSIPHFAHELQ